jgi:cob(I)alamin adenosyltransferase
MVTRTGDKGKSLILGEMRDKDDAVFEVMGTIDELMAVLGIVGNGFKPFRTKIEKINQELYLIMGVISGYGQEKVDVKKMVLNMEEEIEKIEKKQGSIEKFLKVGGQLGVWGNWARTVARRAERKVVALRNYKLKIIPQEDFLSVANYELIMKYFNRLSDYLFMLARKEE